MDAGVERIVDQVVNPKILSVIEPEVEGIMYNVLGVEKPKEAGIYNLVTCWKALPRPSAYHKPRV